ncbi:dihydrofolate reductase family protein [Devosia sp. RR2S18]|uniref:dihydrofolate reductase family protein n=1 Tax=Devosia rhizosphaerae TaxID=3049774 RepID=UPI0025425431|nr:dihydrofolate reductase family protein [Devosia sp. RR2S18]WIJ25872.1 dihydrofolate reductase family protein [Devosia sp. RR2S18]
MPKGHVFIGTSVDGFIARRDGDIGWLTGFSSLGEDHGYNAHMAKLDGIVMGRGTFESVKDIEPWFYEKKVLVLSRTLANSDVPQSLRSKVEIINASPDEATRIAEERGWRGVYIDGGAVIQSFLRAGLIDDMVISRVPVLIGEGLPLFGALDADVMLEHVSTTSFPSGLVQSHYRIKR